ncbi:MAG: hypothetical protein SGPRY_003191 [Prymnesium sp.]
MPAAAVLIAYAIALPEQCPLLRKQAPFAFRTQFSVGGWNAALEMEQWEPGAMLTLEFPREVAISHITHATIVLSGARMVKFRLLPNPPSNTITVQGTGCWTGATSSSSCNPAIYCEHNPLPHARPPLPAPATGFLEVSSPRELSITSKDCRSFRLEWQAALGEGEMEYTVLVSHADVELSQGVAQSLYTVETWALVDSLHAESRYWLGVKARPQTKLLDEPWSTVVIVDGVTEKLDAEVHPENLEMSIEHSPPGNCSSINLVLPELPRCVPADFMAVEWRASAEESPWLPVIDRVDKNDNPKRVVVVDDLDPYEAYEFRVLLHLTMQNQQGNRGSIVEGPSTGALFVDMGEEELWAPPKAHSLGSAGFRLEIPEFSSCRKNLGIEVYSLNKDISEVWEKLSSVDALVTRNGVVWQGLRCPSACTFKLVYTHLVGNMLWESSTSPAIQSQGLPSVRDGYTRLEIRLSLTVEQPLAESQRLESLSIPSHWSSQFSSDLSTALRLEPSEVNVVEIRQSGEYILFDLPVDNAPASSLQALMREPVCSESFALHQPGSCSSSCDRQLGASPENANDGDLRQFHPRYAWQACPGEPFSWWGVDLGAVLSNPYVRVLMGPCCAASYDYRISLRIGQESSPETASTCAHLTVRDGSATGVICTGEGSWIFVTATPNVEAPTSTLSLVEVQTCSAEEISNPLFLQPLTQTIDISSGLIQLDSSSSLPTQLAYDLMPFDPSTREAAWRLPRESSRAIFARVLWILWCAVILAVVVRTGALWRILNLWPAPQASLANLTMEERDDCEHLFEEDQASCELGQLRADAPGIDITFETSEGKAHAAKLIIDHIKDVEQLIAAVKDLGSSVLNSTVDHVSVQYRNDSTGQTEQAYFDPILGESSDITIAKKATSWRVLVL